MVDINSAISCKPHDKICMQNLVEENLGNQVTYSTSLICSLYRSANGQTIIARDSYVANIVRYIGNFRSTKGTNLILEYFLDGGRIFVGGSDTW